MVLENDGQDPLKTMSIHFCFVSGQAAVNLFPVEYYRPEEVVLFVSSEMTGQAEALRSAMLKSVPGLKIKMVPLKDAWDLSGVRDVVWEQLETFDGHEERIAVNATGGTKIMTLGALVAASAAGVRMFYQNEVDNSITLIDPDGREEDRRIRILRLGTKVETVMKAYGFEVVGSSRMPSVNMTEKILIEELIKTSSYREVIPLLNKLSADEETERTLKVSLKGRIPTQRQRAFEALCDKLIDTGHMRICDDLMRFPSEEDRFFVAGGWLERYVFNVLSEMKLRPEGNITIKRAAKNEIDIAFQYEGTLYIVECKTGNLSESNVANQVIYKLESLKQTGGNKTKLILVSYRELHPAAKSRAKDCGIHVIEGEQLKRLKEKLTQCLQK